MARLAFFGTPSFSLPSLNALQRRCEDLGHDIVLVVTQSDKPQGRGKKLLPPPVKQRALELDLLVLQPETLRKDTPSGEEFFARFKELDVDIAIVVAYGKLIPERLLKLPKRGFVNVHASLLPRFRGAAPVQRAIEAGDLATGVCLMDMVKKLDEGDVYVCEKTPIIASDNADTLFRRLGNMGAFMLYENLSSLLDGKIKKTPQDLDGVLYAHMVNKEEAALDFNQSASVISRRVRAFDSQPGCFGFIRNKRIKFFDSFFIETKKLVRAVGEVVVVDQFLGVQALDGIVYFERMQVEGKSIHKIKDATLGFSIFVGDKITSHAF